MAVTWPADLQHPPRLVQAWVGIRQPVRVQHHFLAKLWQLHIYWHGGELAVTLADQTHYQTRLTPGCITILPPDVTSVYRLSERGMFTALHFALGGATANGLPFITNSSGAVEALQRRIQGACAQAVHHPAYGAAELWSALWQLSSSVDSDQKSRSRLVAQARELIESTLAAPLSIAAVAQRLGISSAHLRRLFVRETGMPVKRYQLVRRLERARHLLVHSSQRPAAIAAEIGMPDAHQFNKAMRREFGVAPTTLRASGTVPTANRSES